MVLFVLTVQALQALQVQHQAAQVHRLLQVHLRVHLVQHHPVQVRLRLQVAQVQHQAVAVQVHHHYQVQAVAARPVHLLVHLVVHLHFKKILIPMNMQMVQKTSE